MPGNVIQVRRHEYTGWAERLYLPMIVKGLAVTSRHFFRNLRGFITGRNRTDFVVQYPEERVDYPDAFRGMPVLVELDNGQPRCVACGLCEFACPTDCISIVPGEIEGARIERYPEAFDIDMSRCMMCGLCEEACPEEAIVMSREVEIASFDRESMRYRKEDLLVPENLLERRLDFLRAEYDRADAREIAVSQAAGEGRSEVAREGGKGPSAAPPVPARARRVGRTPRPSGGAGPAGDCGSPVLRRLLDALPGAVRVTHADFGDATVIVTAPSLLDVLRLLRDDPELEFEMLTDVTAVDYLGETPRFEMVYHLYSVSKNQRVRVKVRVSEESPEVDSAVPLWPSANWMEREVWDLYGIRFRGHPDLRRLLLYEEFEGHPLRKDYPKERRQPLTGPTN